MSRRAHDEEDGHVAAVDWSVGLFNVLAGMVCISAAVSNYIVYGISLRIVALMVFYVFSALTFIALEIVPLAGYVQRSASHLNTYAGRASHYFLAAILASDTVFVHISHYNLYIWLWANAVALASISLAFLVLALASAFTGWVPKPRSMDLRRTIAPLHHHGDGSTRSHDVESSGTAFVRHDPANPVSVVDDGLSINSYLPSKIGDADALDMYTLPPASLFEERRLSGHAHGNKWQTGSPPAHVSMWPGRDDGGSQCSTPRGLPNGGKAPRRLSAHSGGGQAYETTTQRMTEPSSPPTRWSHHLNAASDGANRGSAYHRQLTYDAVQTHSEDDDAPRSRRLSRLDTQSPPQRVKSLRKRVFIPSAGAAIELSSGESSSESEQDEESDNGSVYSLPSGISPSKPSPLDVPEKGTQEPLGRRLTRRETKSLRHKIRRGLERAAA